MAMAVVMALGLSACGGSNSAASSSAAGSVSGSASGSVSNGDPAFTTVTPGKLTMSTNASFPPYEMVADDGSFEGIGGIVVRLAAFLEHQKLFQQLHHTWRFFFFFIQEDKGMSLFSIFMKTL